jgi:hypothetical protein
MAMIPAANEAAAVTASVSSSSAPAPAPTAAAAAAAIADVCDEDDAAAFVDLLDDHEFGEDGDAS